jgi:competence ComEA-like helix-hairpin-helix protein
MTKRELIVLIVIIVILTTLTVVNYIRRENAKKSYVILVEEAALQISINSAQIEEFEELLGIGPELAQRIVAYRNTHGQFEKLEDLKRVKGIGNKLYNNVLPYIKL